MQINSISHLASLIGEPARTAMLLQLMDDRQLTASELARAAGVAASTASGHLAQLIDAGVLRVNASGRHRYHRLASPAVAHMLESIMQVAAQSTAAQTRVRVGPRDESMRRARRCYDHLGGRLAVAITQRLALDGGLVFDEEHGALAAAGRGALAELGLEVDPAATAAATYCRPCLDWSERRFHMAGRLARHICSHCLERGWLLRRPESRALDISPTGQVALQRWMGLALWREAELGAATG
ncbi:MAG: winged helix-turn-helix domain-containing protein [Burkholderiaceae bacterium]